MASALDVQQKLCDPSSTSTSRGANGSSAVAETCSLSNKNVSIHVDGVDTTLAEIEKRSEVQCRLQQRILRHQRAELFSFLVKHKRQP